MEPWLKADFALIKCEVRRPAWQPDLQQDSPELQPAHVHGSHDNHRTDEASWWQRVISIPNMSSRPGIFVNRIVEVADSRP